MLIKYMFIGMLQITGWTIIIGTMFNKEYSIISTSQIFTNITIALLLFTTSIIIYVIDED